MDKEDKFVVVAAGIGWVDGPGIEQRRTILAQCDKRLAAQILLVCLSQSLDELRRLRDRGGGSQLLCNWLLSCSENDRARLRSRANWLAESILTRQSNDPIALCVLLGQFDWYEQKRGVLSRVAARLRWVWSKICPA